MPEDPIHILIVDDHPAVRQGVAVLLAPDGIEVCAEAERPDEALQRLGECHPDVALVDLSLDGEDGTPLIAQLCARGVKVLVYSMYHDARRVSAAFAAGALGYVTKREFHNILVDGIRAVAAGRRYASPKAGAALAESAAGIPTPASARPLSPKEAEVYLALGHGMDADEIAAALGIGESTVQTYFDRLLVKLNLKGMHELRRRAIGASRRAGGPPLDEPER